MNHNRNRPRVATLLVIFLVPCLSMWAGLCFAEEEAMAKTERICCGETPTGIIWYGSNPRMTFEELARYCGPILWFSPDEPLLDLAPGSEVRIPEPVPFEEPADSPVVYYRVRRLLLRERVSTEAYESDPNDTNATGLHLGQLKGLLSRKGALLTEAFESDPIDTNASVLRLDQIGGINLDYFFYYSSEEGLGRHPHDVESAEFMLEVIQNPECPGCEYAISVKRVIAKAHGLDWYDNTLNVDDWVSFPLTLLAEEGKHASCTDRNGDGYYSPGYDVNTRINDAWGCRDVIRTGALFTASYQAWMTKVRKPGTLVVPPLPEDSPHYDDFLGDDRDLANKSTYTLRPFPSAEPARGDAKLFSLIDTKGYPEWPVEEPNRDIDKMRRTLLNESFTRSLGVAYRYDGRHGVSFVFPLLIVKNVEEPLTGGWLVNRFYTRSRPETNDYGWNMLYTPSASRWLDPYFSLGVEIENQQIRGHTDTSAHFAFETGVKFRGNLAHTPLKFMTFLTDFWGLRVGLKYLGFAAVEDLSFVVEVGAGVW